MKKLTQKLTIVLLSAFLVVLVSCDDTGSGEETKKTTNRPTRIKQPNSDKAIE